MIAPKTSLIALAATLLAGCASTVNSGVVDTPSITSAPVFTAAPLAADVGTDLPRIARPLHYAITVEPDALALTFAGKASVDLELYEQSSDIVLHANALEIAHASLRTAAGSLPLTVSYQPDKQTVTFHAERPIAPGTYTLETAYTGTINTQANGLFALDYIDKLTGADKRGLFTQFEAPDARRFAPMFDEPSYKATFDLTAIVPADQMALSNMPVASEQALGNGLKRVTFATSPKMSSYLLFFGLGDFERIAKPTPSGTEVGIVSPTGSGEQARFALDSLAPLVGYFNDYFGQPYPLPKLDNIAGPGQSQFFGAMENWGAIFTFERILLNDPATTSARGRARIYGVQAHETAHQWFGDLVTMAWWDDLWLNEGFASWMATKATANFHPEWYPLLSRVGGREAAMGLDAYATTHPIVQEITTVEQTNQAFDTITYQKGEAVISMLEAYAGEDVWRDGLRRYMAANKFSNAKTADLWAAIEAAGARDLTTIAHDFTTKPGVPLVEVASATCEAGETLISLKQSEFSRDRKADAAANPQRWHLPVLARIDDGAPVRKVMDDASANMAVPGCGTVIVNAGQLGYYRTLYTPGMLQALNAAMPTLDPIDQLGLLNDQLALAEAGYQPAAPALNLLAAIPMDANPLVASEAVDTYSTLYDRLKSDPQAQHQMAKLAIARWSPRLDQLGFTARAGEPLVEDGLRSELISSLGAMGDARVLNEANRLFAALQDQPTALDGPLKTTWLGIIAANASPAQWDQIHALARNTRSTVERSAYYAMLGRAKDPALAARALDLALTDEPGVTTSAAIISAVAEENGDQAVRFFFANEEKIAPLIDASARSRYLSRIANGVEDAALIVRLEARAQTAAPDEAIPLNRVLGRLRERAASRPRLVAGVRDWLANR